MSVDDLIQLMRLSGTDKVRAYLEKETEMARMFPGGASDKFLIALKLMFTLCKRDSISEAWPTMIENETLRST